jgi:competence ComEA-like helix-hairpin-helix protein
MEMCRRSAAFTAIALAAFATLDAGGQEWPHRDGDPGGRRFSPLTQITPANVGRLRPAWTFDTGSTNLQVTPLVVGGVMYLTAASSIFALEPETGTVIWKFAAPAIVSRRGLAYWPGDAGTPPRLFAGAGEQLVAVDARSGTTISSFGDRGYVDLKAGIRGERNLDGRFSLVSPPAIYKNIVITGGNNGEGAPSAGLYGDIRGWDAYTGKLLWTFHTVPRPGEPGVETWEGESWKNRSGTNMWSFFTVDVERGIVFAPLGSPTSDFYGADRKGANLYGNSVVALDAANGKLKWHQQLVHHDLWDWDLPAAPTLIDVRREGRTIPAVAVLTKMSTVFIFNRETGAPIFGIEERPVPKSTVPGEASWPTQPFPLKPPPLARMTFDPAKDFYSLTPEHAAYCRELWQKHGMYTHGPFTPPGLEGTMVTFPSTLGGGNWNGFAYDARLGLIFTNVMNLGQVASMQLREDARSGENTYVRTSPWGTAYGRFWNPDTKIPCSAAPFGELVAVDVNAGEIAWKVPIGRVDELHARGIRHTGALNIGGPMVTASGLLFVGATTDGRFRAFDSRSGQQLWEVELEASAHAVPMTFMGKDKRQYIVVAAGGGSLLSSPPGSTIVAFALSDSPTTVPMRAATATASKSEASGLPEGDGRDSVLKMCSGCHGLPTATARRRTRAEWESMVEAMAAVGAPGTRTDISRAVDYLAWRFGRVNVNVASAEELQRVLDLSASEAAAIVEYRSRQGALGSMQDLEKVPGLDGASRQRALDRVVFAGR